MRNKLRFSFKYMLFLIFCSLCFVFLVCEKNEIHSLFLTNISVLNILEGNLVASYQKSIEAKKIGFINSGQFYNQYMLDHQKQDLEKAFLLNPKNVNYIFLFADETIINGDWISSNHFLFSVPFARYLARRGMELAYDSDIYQAKKGLYYLSFSRKILQDSQISNFLGSVLCFKYNSYQKGEPLLIQAIVNNPYIPSYYSSLAYVNANKSNLPLRRSYQEIARRLDLTNIWTLMDMGNSLLQENKIDESILYYKEAKKIDSSMPYVYYSLANAFQKQDKINLAEKEYLDALRINSLDSGPRYEWGVFLYNRKEFLRAITQFTLAITLKPDNPWSYYYRALSYKNVGKFENAKRDIMKCLSFDINNQTFKNFLNEINRLSQEKT